MNTLRVAIFAAGLAALQTAAAWDGETDFSPDVPLDFVPIAISTPDATHGFWAVGQDGGHALLVRYGANAEFQFLRYSPLRADTNLAGLGSPGAGLQVLDVRAMPDGGALVLANEGLLNSYCGMHRFDALGNLRWDADPLYPESSTSLYRLCPPVTIDGTGGVWMQRDAGLLHLSADGAVQSVMAPDDLAIEDLLGDPASSSVYAVGAVGGYETGLATIEKIDSAGVRQWRVQAPAAAGASDFLALAADATGVYAFGSFIRDSVEHDTLYGMHLSASGKVLSQWDPGWFAGPVDAVEIGTDGQALVLYRSSDPSNDGAQLLAKTGAGGTFAWRTTTRAQDCFNHLLHTAANGDAVISDTGCDQNASQNTDELVRIGSNGTPIADTRLDGIAAFDMQVLADSSSVSLVQADAQGGTFHPPMLERRARDGSALTAPQTTALGRGSHVVASTLLAADGSSYVLDDTAGFVFSRIAPDGHVAWTQQGSGSWTGDLEHSRIVLAGTSACLVGGRGTAQAAECHDAASGAAQAAFTFATAAQGQSDDTAAFALRDGHILVWHTAADRAAHVTVISTGGSTLSDATPLASGESLDARSTNSQGVSVFAPKTGTIAAVDASGKRLYTQAVGALGTIAQTAVLDDGSALVLSANGAAVKLSRIDTAGHVSWTQAVPSAGGGHSFNRLGSVIVDGGSVYVVFAFEQAAVFGAVPPPLVDYLLQRIALSDGSPTWNWWFDGPLSHRPQAQLDAATRRLAIVTAWPDKLRTQVLNADAIALVDERFDPCARDCTLLSAGIGSDRALRTIVSATDATGGFAERILRRNAPLDPRPAIRADQPGLAGAWYAPYASGQGFSIDYFADSNTLFMPWFTYSATGSTSPAGLDWYALQGAAASGARSVDLAITAADPGQFAAGSVGVKAVGAAQLTFTDCSNASLAYQFDSDVNGGASGVITLQRLTPSTQACVLADGSSGAAQAPNAAAQGFEARQSGSWYDAATSGQGLEITVLPPGGGSNGLLFAAWFTFDPAGAADEATQRHWFTLQGDLATAKNGAVSLPILRTIGGRFDAQPTADTVQVGTATLTFSACDTAELDYRFDNSDVAHAFARLSGTIHLTRIGGCAAP